MSNPKKKPNTTNNQTTPMANPHKLTTLQLIFHQQCSLAWDVLDAESHIYTATDLNLQKITHLTSLYMKVIEKLNSLQDPREQYFSYKMQKLMSEPYIIRFFTNQHQQTRNALDDRRKVLQQKLEQEAQRQNHKKIIEKTLQIQSQKEQRVRNRIKNVLEQADKKLQERIKKRTMQRLERSVQYSPATSLQILNTSAEQEESVTSSGGSIRDRMRQNKSSDFELLISQDQRFKEMKRELEQEENEERFARRTLGNFRNMEKH